MSIRFIVPLVFLLTAITPALQIISSADTTDLWILSGQSNACGRAKLPGPEPIERVLHWNPTTSEFAVAQDPLPGMGTEGTGPWVAAAQEAARGGVPVKMVGFASGGKPISYWHPGQSGDKGLMLRIAKAGQGAGVFLWYQGESNTGDPQQVATYASELKMLVARVRRQAGNEKMTAVIVQLGAFTRDEERDFPGLREAQRQFVIADGNALLVPALGRPLKDTVHLNNAGYRELGREIGRAVLRVRHERSNVNWPGPVLDDAAISADGKSVVAHFAEVEELTGATAADFAAIDATGTVVAATAKSLGTLVKLQFERPLELPARLVYAHGNNPKASLSDEAGNRAPAVQHAIRKGKALADKPTVAINGAGLPRHLRPLK